MPAVSSDLGLGGRGVGGYLLDNNEPHFCSLSLCEIRDGHTSKTQISTSRHIPHRYIIRHTCVYLYTVLAAWEPFWLWRVSYTYIALYIYIIYAKYRYRYVQPDVRSPHTHRHTTQAACNGGNGLEQNSNIKHTRNTKQAATLHCYYCYCCDY